MRNPLKARVSRRVTVGLATVGILTAGVAGASWSAQGGGNAKAQGGRLQAVTATAASPTTELFPGQTAEAALTLTNPNPVAMTVSSIVGSGAITSDSAACDEGGHGVTFTNPTGAWEIAKNASLTLRLPEAVAMALDSDDACQGAAFTIPVTVTASVSGQGGGADPTTTTTMPAQFAWTPPSYVFPATELGASSAPQSFILRNTGGAPAQVELGTLGGPEFPVVSNSCTGATLAANESCSVGLHFRPTSQGSRTAVLQARPAGTATFVTANVSGVGRNPAILMISPSSANYGGRTVNTESAPFTFQVVNTGESEARSLSAVVVGFDANAFLIRSNTCGQVLAPGTSCLIGVSFRPTHTGANSAHLVVNFARATGSSSTGAQLAGSGL